MANGEGKNEIRFCPNSNDVIPVKLTRHNSESPASRWEKRIKTTYGYVLERSKRSQIKVNKRYSEEVDKGGGNLQ